MSSGKVYDVRPHSAKGAHVEGMAEYRTLHAQSVEDPETFWDRQAQTVLRWMHPYEQVCAGSFEDGDVRWFTGGRLNACDNCLDRHIDAGHGDDVAIIWEKDEPGESVEITFKEALHEVCQIANVLKKFGIKKGDTVTIYSPMMPQTQFAMLACARIGAVFSVVFAGFSADSLRTRIMDLKTRFIITADEGLRGGRTIALKKVVDAAIEGLDFVERTFVFERTGAKVNMIPWRDILMTEEMPKHRPFCAPEPMESEDPFFVLYTSGSTGKPKGLLHTTGGYLTYAAFTGRIVFDFRPGDVFACVADVGWITGHTYTTFAPLLFLQDLDGKDFGRGVTTVIFESTPMYPAPSRYWALIEAHGVTQFYTAPTAIRALMRHSLDHIEEHNLSSLRVLGSVGEPINEKAWKWYFEHIGKSRCALVDTWWQTETGGIAITPLPGVTPLKPGSATLPFFGILPKLLDPHSGKEVSFEEGQESSGVLCIAQPWPSMARTVFDNHERYLNTYFRPYPGYYFSGDGARRDADGYFTLEGRVDDVLNCSGHRLGSAEIETALVAYETVAEAAVVGFPHEIKGEGICCYVILKMGVQETPELIQDLKNQIRTVIGPFATPDFIVITSGLPKTRSGKIMRRVLRKIISLEADQLGDTSTLADPSIVDKLIDKVAKLRN